MLSILFLFSCQFRTWFEFNNFLCSNLDRLFSRGLIPIRAPLSTTLKVPKPTNDTLSPAFIALVTDAINASNAFLNQSLTNQTPLP